MIVSGLEWLKFETGDPQPTGYSPLGLKWKERGSEKPAVGQEIKNKALAAELRQRLKFTRKDSEWDEFEVSSLSGDSYIQSGNKYFSPDGDQKLAHSKLSQALSKAKTRIAEFTPPPMGRVWHHRSSRRPHRQI